MTEAQAYRVFEAVRWPGGQPARCPHCAAASSSYLIVPRDGVARSTRTGARSQRRVWRCRACRQQFSVLTGSVFEGTRVSLSRWLSALSGLHDGELEARTITRLTGVHRDTAKAMAALVAAAGRARPDQPQG